MCNNASWNERVGKRSQISSISRSIIIPPLHCNTRFFLSKMKPSSVVYFCMISALLLLRTPTAVESVTCDPTLLNPCAAAFLFSTRPSSLCCSRIKSQVPCYCQYLNDPSLSGYISGGKKVAAACGVSLPSCWYRSYHQTNISWPCIYVSIHLSYILLAVAIWLPSTAASCRSLKCERRNMLLVCLSTWINK